MEQLFDIRKKCLKLQTQAPNEANFYESQRIALKIKSIHLIHERIILYQSQVANQAESMGKYDFYAVEHVFSLTRGKNR